jgi:hypothetical protein
VSSTFAVVLPHVATFGQPCRCWTDTVRAVGSAVERAVVADVSYLGVHRRHSLVMTQDRDGYDTFLAMASSRAVATAQGSRSILEVVGGTLSAGEPS